jgi:hypothetical protein
MSGMKKGGVPPDPNAPQDPNAPPPPTGNVADDSATQPQPGGYGGVPGLRPPPKEAGPTMGQIPAGQPVRRPGDPGTYTTTMEEQPRTTTEQPHQWDQQPPPQQAQPRRFPQGAQGQYGAVPPNPNPGAVMGRKPMPMVPQQGKGMRTA